MVQEMSDGGLKTVRRALFLAALTAAGLLRAGESARVVEIRGATAITNRMPVADGRLEFAANRFAGADAVKVILDAACATRGEEGFFVLPNNMLGSFRETAGGHVLQEPPMSFFGMKTPRGTFVSEAFGWTLWHSIEVTVEDGRYAVAHVFDLREERPAEAFGVTFEPLPATAGYPEMAAAYRAHKLDGGIVRPIRARCADQPELAGAATSVEVRVRQAWKPAPSKVPEQNEFNEPPLHVAVTFERALDLVRACRGAGIASAEFCLVGWNRGGHDGAYPQLWPVEPALGGAEGLKRLVAEARDLGYRIVLHNNFQDTYTVAEGWDEGDMSHDRQGEVRSNAGSGYVWSGGRTYLACPKRMWEKYVRKDMHRIAALGCRGLHYSDVISNYRHPCCFDSRHPCSRREGVRYYLKMLEEMRRTVGGAFSEGPHDFVAGGLDACLYVTVSDPSGKDLPRLMDRFVPLWQLVYHGIILSSPYHSCMNYTVKSDENRLALVEFGGRPVFYVHHDFFDDTRWKGKGDLSVASDEDLAAAVREIRKGADEYARLADLQFEYMTGHRLLAPGVALTTYGNGARTVVNRTRSPFVFEGVEIPARDWRRL